jgi:hypothetical protein
MSSGFSLTLKNIEATQTILDIIPVYEVDKKELRLLNLQRADLLARRRYF